MSYGGPVGVASSPITLTPNGLVTGTVTPSSTGAGTFSPTTLTWTNDSSSKTVTYTPTNGDGLTHFLSFASVPALGFAGALPIPYSVANPTIYVA